MIDVLLLPVLCSKIDAYVVLEQLVNTILLAVM